MEDRERRLPPVAEGDQLTVVTLTPEAHATQPPARYTEASLVKSLEELGIGRPSTYASIIGTIQDRGYAYRKGSALVPTFTAFAVVNLLEDHFSRLVDYRFTAEVEDDLDEIAAGDRASIDWLTRFYFGSGAGNGGNGAGPRAGRAEGLKRLVSERLGEIDAREVNSIPIGEDDSGVPLVVRVGRYGPYVQRGTEDGAERASIDESIPPDELTVERALELLRAPSQDRVLGTDPDTGEEISVRVGRFGAYVQRGEGKAPARASLFASMSPETITLEDALRLLTLPRTVGVAPDGEEITARTGRYGPFVKKGTQSRSLAAEEDLFTVSARAGPGTVRPAEDAGPARRCRPAAARAWSRPGLRQADRRQGRALRALRHGRGGQREPAQGRLGRGDRPRPGRGAARRPSGPGRDRAAEGAAGTQIRVGGQGPGQLRPAPLALRARPGACAGLLGLLQLGGEGVRVEVHGAGDHAVRCFDVCRYLVGIVGLVDGDQAGGARVQRFAEVFEVCPAQPARGVAGHGTDGGASAASDGDRAEDADRGEQRGHDTGGHPPTQAVRHRAWSAARAS